MTTQDIQQVEQAWPSLAPFLFVPQNEHEYTHLVAILDTPIDSVGEDEQHTLASLMDIISVLIEHYENEHVPEITEI
jgi:HTH-type transcriptional regulator/antitoxin HigA